jgi:hypothetical protein
MAFFKGPKDTAGTSDFAPPLAEDPVFERTGADRWVPQPTQDLFEPGVASGPWADTLSSFDLEPPAGPGFLDPGSLALENHVAPMMASDATQIGAIAGASADLATPVYGGDGGGDGKGKPSPSDLF